MIPTSCDEKERIYLLTVRNRVSLAIRCDEKESTFLVTVSVRVSESRG